MSDRGDQVQKLRGRVGAKQKRTCVLVLGMHRSGTSALTRVLNIAGAGLPANLMGPYSGNETGHWESCTLIKYHDVLLGELGSSWHDWRALDINRLPIKRRKEIKTEVRDIIKNDFRRAQLFVVKDPRICRFTPFFLDILHTAGFDVRTTLIFRNPLEVCESLEQRTAVWGPERSRADAALLWLRHVLDSENATRDTKRTIVTYNGLLNDWKAVFGKISDKLEIDGLYPIAEIAPQVSEFLSQSHRHHTHRTEEVLLDPMLRDWIGGAYEALLVLARNPGSQKAMARLDEISQEFDRATPILHQFFQGVRIQHQSEVTDLKAGLATAGSENEELGAKLSQAETKLAELGTTLAERTEAEYHRQVLGEDFAKERQNLSQKLLDRGATLETEQSKVTDLQDQLATSRQEIQTVGTELANAREWQRAYEKSTSWRITAPLRFVVNGVFRRTDMIPTRETKKKITR